MRLRSSGVNPSDVKTRQARPLDGPLVVPHSDGAGLIDSVGAGAGAGVSARRIGERVWLWNAQWRRTLGTAAEYVALPEAQAVPLPDTVDDAAGACLGIPAMTAFHAVERLGELAGQTVLVIGASSSVGHYAAKLAAQAGARVIGTVGSAAKAVHAERAGVAATIDYKREAVGARLLELTAGRGVDAIIDTDFASTVHLLSEGVLRPHGQLVSYGSNSYAEIPIPYRQLLFGSIGLQLFLVYELSPAAREAAVAGLGRLLVQGRLQHTIGGRWPLAGIAAAHEAVEQGALIGNAILEIAP